MGGKYFWELRMMVVAVFGFVGMHWSLNTPLTMFPPTQDPIRHGVPCTYIGRGLQGGSATNKIG